MKDFYIVGTIIGPHALKGEVKILSVTDFKDDRYKRGNKLYIEKDEKMVEVIVQSFRPHKDYDLVSFVGYNDINDIEKFRKCKVYVHESQLEDLEEDEFYYHDLIGCEVIHEDRILGRIKDIVNYGASDIIIVVNEQGKEMMIPFVDDFIVDIDLDAKKVIINVIEGLLE